jgi:hypothetical protein
MPRLDRGIRYAAAYRLTNDRLDVLDRPVKPGDGTKKGVKCSAQSGRGTPEAVKLARWSPDTSARLAPAIVSSNRR